MVRWDPETDELRDTPRKIAKRNARQMNASLKTRRAIIRREVKSKIKKNKNVSEEKKQREKQEQELPRQPSCSGVVALKSSGEITEIPINIEVPTTMSTVTISTTTITSTTTTTMTSAGILVAGVLITTSLHISEWMIRQAHLSSSPIVSVAESSRVTPAIANNIVETPKASDTESNSDDETDNNIEDEHDKADRPGCRGEEEKNVDEEEPVVWNGMTMKQLDELMKFLEEMKLDKRRPRRAYAAETIIGGQENKRIIETPKGRGICKPGQ